MSSRPFCGTCKKFKPLEVFGDLGIYGLCMDEDANWKNKRDDNATWSTNICIFGDYDKHYVKGGDKE